MEIDELEYRQLKETIADLSDKLDRLCSSNLGLFNNYKKGDIVVWKGFDPSMGVIKGRCPRNPYDSWEFQGSDGTHHYKNLRYASQEEILNFKYFTHGS